MDANYYKGIQSIYFNNVISNIIKIGIFLILLISGLNAETLKNCKWNNQKGTPCIVINKTPNTSEYSELGIN